MAEERGRKKGFFLLGGGGRERLGATSRLFLGVLGMEEGRGEKAATLRGRRLSMQGGEGGGEGVCCRCCCCSVRRRGEGGGIRRRIGLKTAVNLFAWLSFHALQGKPSEVLPSRRFSSRGG